MGKDNWYRNTKWDDDIRDNFLKRLRRSRSDYNKAQYAYIQAYTLSQTRVEKNIVAALELTDIILHECPAPEHLPGVYQVRADCFEIIGDLESAVDALRNCVGAELHGQGIKVDAVLTFAALTVKHELTDHYSEALSFLKPGASMVFSQRQFEYAAILAVIFHHKYFYRRARKWATVALELHKSIKDKTNLNQAVKTILEPNPSILEKLEFISSDDKNFLKEYISRAANILKRRNR